MMPDYLAPWIAIPAAIVMCIIWRRQVVAERKSRR